MVSEGRSRPSHAEPTQNIVLLRSQVLLLTVSASALVAATPQDAMETFVWNHGGDVIGRLSVPKKYTVEVYDYREGIVTTLHYQDEAYIVLQVGGMYRLPLFQDPEYKLTSSTEKDFKTIRIGRTANGELHWREDNCRPKKVADKRHSLLSIWAIWAPNIGYAKVNDDQKAEFDKSMDSFVREVDRIIPSKQ